MHLQRIILALALFLAPVSQASAQVESGKPAPDFTAKDTHGKDVSLAALKGKEVVLEWTNHQCPFVIKHYESGNMQKTQAYAKEKGAVWISVISSASSKQGYVTDEEANTLATDRKAVPDHIIRDENGDLGRLYGAKTTPHMFVITKEGVLAYQGAIDDRPTPDKADIAGATNYVNAALDALAEGKTPEKTTTQPYGCSVKY